MPDPRAIVIDCAEETLPAKSVNCTDTEIFEVPYIHQMTPEPPARIIEVSSPNRTKIIVI